MLRLSVVAPEESVEMKRSESEKRNAQKRSLRAEDDEAPTCSFQTVNPHDPIFVEQRPA